jgi:glycosyltransferase involved in cell wall biosynthesis
MPVRVSVIIPCFNQGGFVREALESIEVLDNNAVEIIIVNDGSTDPETNKILDLLAKEGYHVIFQNNKGLAGARNAGILEAVGDYILPLDADNQLLPGFLTRGITLFDNHPEVAVIYGNAEFFGDKSGEWKPGSFNLQKLMLSNYIDACAMIRRSVFDSVGLYDEQMKFMGWEDWDRWLAISFAGHCFYYLDEKVFRYRVGNESMIRKLYNKYEKPNYLENYVHKKYVSHMGHHWILNNTIIRFKKNPILFLTKLIITAYFPGYHRKLLIKNKIRNGL